MTTKTNEWLLVEHRRFAREVVLCLAGLFSVGRVPDELMWESARALQRIIERAANRIRTHATNGATTSAETVRPHPAFQELLRRIEHEPSAEEVAQ